jgi:KDO2-lipid IV(A) lauroyltransferase
MTDLVELTDDSGRDLVAAAHERGPAIYVTPHLGNWEIMAQAVARHGVRIHAVAQRVRNPLIAEFVDRTRRVYGLDLLSSRGAAKGLVRALRQGDAVAILMDQNVRPRHGGVFVDFFGLPVPTSRAPASLARRLQVPILCFACLRTPTGFRLREERLPKPTAAYTDDLELTQDLMRTMERLVRQAPTQYMWGYERWRYLPPDCDAQTLDRFPAYAEHG